MTNKSHNNNNNNNDKHQHGPTKWKRANPREQTRIQSKQIQNEMLIDGNPTKTRAKSRTLPHAMQEYENVIAKPCGHRTQTVKYMDGFTDPW